MARLRIIHYLKTEFKFNSLQNVEVSGALEPIFGEKTNAFAVQKRFKMLSTIPSGMEYADLSVFDIEHRGESVAITASDGAIIVKVRDAMNGDRTASAAREEMPMAVDFIGFIINEMRLEANTISGSNTTANESKAGE